MRVLIAASVLLTCGCLAPQRLRLPSCTPRSIPYERAETKVHDPFPRSDLGPETSMRPPGFIEPRTQERHVKEKTGLSLLREQYGAPAPSPFPLGQRPGYGNAVR